MNYSGEGPDFTDNDYYLVMALYKIFFKWNFLNTWVKIILKIYFMSLAPLGQNYQPKYENSINQLAMHQCY